jgi:hypothetical protein
LVRHVGNSPQGIEFLRLSPKCSGRGANRVRRCTAGRRIGIPAASGLRRDDVDDSQHWRTGRLVTGPSMRHWLGALLGLAATLVAADWVAWLLATARMQASLQAAVTEMRAGGWMVRCSAPERGGWPWTASLAVADVRVQGGAGALPGGVTWSADRLVLSPQGEETLRVSHLPALAFAADLVLAKVPLGAGRLDHAELTAAAVAGGLLHSRRRQDVGIGQLSVQVYARQSAAGGLDASLNFAARDIGLPDNFHWPLGGSVKSLAAAVTLASPAVSGADSHAQAQSWRDGGGQVSVRTLDLHWGPLWLQGDAKLGLDAGLQPAGTGHARVTGFGPALDALADAGVIGPGMAVTYKAVLGLMASDPSSAITLPLTLRDSTLSLGEIPLSRFKDVAWR